METVRPPWHIRRMPPSTRSLALPDGEPSSPLHALAGWVADNLQWLKGQLRRRDRSEQDVDDLIQEAILRVAQSCERHEVHDVAGMLVCTVTRLSMNECRDRARRPIEPESIEALDRVRPIIDASPSAEALIEAEENWALVKKVLDTVDERTRKAFLLNRLQGLKYRDIAQQLGISVSTVEKDITWVMGLLIDAAQRQQAPR
jgi:RNA polymerase sigma-70 factor (ECF subfamily)